MSIRCVYAPRTLISSLVCAHDSRDRLLPGRHMELYSVEMVADEGMFHDHGGHDVACHCRTSGGQLLSPCDVSFPHD